MIDINDNDFKLLKMNESLLNRLSVQEGDIYYQTLSNYESLAKRIEKNNYDIIVEKINNYDKHNLTLEEELELLEDLENDYRQLEELQCKLKKNFSELELSDLSTIDIDVILYRKDLISGYLVNLKNIDDIHKQLEKNNNDLIVANKQREATERKYQTLEDELRRNFINAEGRLLNINSSKFKNASIREEYYSINIDLINILSDNNQILEKLTDIGNLKIEKDEILNTAEICYENIPTLENKEVLDFIRKESLNINYQLSLIKIVKLISDNVDSFDKMIEKREKIKDLINRRNDYLRELDIKYSIDPFMRIKLDEQIQYIIQLGDNTKDINRIRKLINELDQKLAFLNEKNKVFLKDLENNVSIINDKTSLSDIDISTVDFNTVNNDDIFESIDIEPLKKCEDNQVVRVVSVNEDFKIDRVTEKASSVIMRVKEIFSNNDVDDKNDDVVIDEKSPELVIQDSSVIDESKMDDKIFEISDIMTHMSTNNDNNILESVELQEQVDLLNDVSSDVLDDSKDILQEVKDEVSVKDLSQKNEIHDLSIFQDNVSNPFNSVKLFDDRLEEVEEIKESNDDYYLNQGFEDIISDKDEEFDILFKNDMIDVDSSDDILNDDKNDDDDLETLPDAFWEVYEEPKQEVVEPSFEEQIKKLKLTT